MLLSSANGIRYGVSTPPPILEPSDTTVPFIRATDIKNGEILTENLLHIDIHQSERMQKCLLEAGEMILVRSGVNTGDCAVVPDALAGSYAAYDLILNFTNEVVPLFVSTFLDTEVGRLQLNVLKYRSAQPHLNAEEVSSVLVPKPPLEIQRSLVAEIEAARQTRKQKLAQADELLSSLDAYLLDQLGLSAPEESDRKTFAIRVSQIKSRLDSYSNQPRFRRLIQLLQSHQFPVAQLSSVATDIFSGITPKSGGTAYTDELEGVPFVRSGEITKDGRVIENSAIFIKPEIHEGLMRRSQLQQGDLLIAIVGATIGSVGVYNRPTPANINQAIAAVRLDNSRVLPDFVRWFLSSAIGQAILDYLKRPVARANINLEEIGEIFILIPPLETQRSVIEQVDHARLEMHKLRQEAETEWEAAKTRFERQLLAEEA